MTSFVLMILSYMALVSSETCTTSDFFLGKRLNVKTYFEHSATEVVSCYINCQDDDKCISINFSKGNSTCQRLRRSHKFPARLALKDAVDWMYVVNDENPCNRDPYPCTEKELCEKKHASAHETFHCTSLFNISGEWIRFAN